MAPLGRHQRSAAALPKSHCRFLPQHVSVLMCNSPLVLLTHLTQSGHLMFIKKTRSHRPVFAQRSCNLNRSCFETTKICSKLDQPKAISFSSAAIMRFRSRSGWSSTLQQARRSGTYEQCLKNASTACETLGCLCQLGSLSATARCPNPKAR